MKAIESPDLLCPTAQFDELCVSFGSIAESLQTGRANTVAPHEIDLASARLSQIRTELELPQHYWPSKEGNLITNDYFAVTQIAKQIGYQSVRCTINDKGRVSQLRLHYGSCSIDGVDLLSELQALCIEGYAVIDPSPLAKCFRLNKLELRDVNSQITNVESTLKDMHWLSRITVTGSEAMNLAWATEHRALALLRVPGLKIEDIAPLSNCIKLVTLGLADNPIRSLAPLKALPNLLTLDISRTPLSDLRSACEIESLLELTISSDMVTLPDFMECNQVLRNRGGRIEVVDGGPIR